MRRFYLFSLLFSLLLASSLVFARPGDLDTAFGAGGWVSTTVSGFELHAADVEIQNDQKVVICGYAERGEDKYFLVARYHPDGRLDETFLGNQAIPTPPGIVIRNLPDSTEEKGSACALQPDGKIVVVGYGIRDGKKRFAIARYRSDNGQLDGSFDEEGWTYPLFQPAGTTWADEAAHDVAIHSNKIVVVGYAKRLVKNFAVVRYHMNDGALDTSFDGDGKSLVHIGGGRNIANAIVIQSNGKIVVTGSKTFAGINELALARFKSGACPEDSCLDTTFSGDGKESTDLMESSTEYPMDIVLQPNGKIVLAGVARINEKLQFALASYQSTCDAGECFEGAIFTDFETSTVAWLFAAKLKENKILLTGFATVDGKAKLALARYKINPLSLDEDFGEGGKAIIDNSGFESESGVGIAWATDGKIIVAGSGTNADISSLLWSRHIDTFNSDLTVEMRQNEDPNLGPEERSYTVRVTNNGPDNAEDVVVTITPPAGTVMNALPYICTEEEMVITCDVGDIVNGATFTLGFVADLTGAADNSTFTLNVISGENDLNTENNVALLNINKQIQCDPAVCDPAPPEGSGASGGCLSLASGKMNRIYLLSMIGLVLLLYPIRKATKIVMLPRPTKRRTKEPFFKS